MSALGHKRTFRIARAVSALPSVQLHVRFGPRAVLFGPVCFFIVLRSGLDCEGRLDSTSRINSTAVGVICGIGASLFWAARFAGVRHGLNVGFSPADLMIHRYIWSGLALLPTMVRGGIGNLNGIGWGRGILLAVLGGPVFAILGYAGFLLVPLGHGGVIQPSSGTLGGLFLATLVLRERLIPSRLVGALIIVCGLAVIRHRHMACADHGVQRLVYHLAELEEGSWPGDRHARRKDCGGEAGRHDLAHQHYALNSDAVLHGRAAERRPLTGKRNGRFGR